MNAGVREAKIAGVFGMGLAIQVAGAESFPMALRSKSDESAALPQLSWWAIGDITFDCSE
jgi:hypothetical protein